MARTVKVNENFSLRFNSREDQSGDTVMDCSIDFDNPKDDATVIRRLNTWLQAIGRTELVVSSKDQKLGA